MAKGDTYPVEVHEQPASDAWRCLRYRLDATLCYVPYFYNPPLSPDGRRLLFIASIAGTEQAFLLDTRTREARQLTDARGRNQNWAPYIRAAVTGIRPQFVCWSRPDWSRVLFWEGNELKRVHVETLHEETLHKLSSDQAPSQPHCSETGLVAFGHLPAELQQRMLRCDVEDVEDELQAGCGLTVLDSKTRRVLASLSTPFWPNHVAASPDGLRVLHCHEGSWRRQRMHLLDLRTGETARLRPQSDGAAIGHEFWMGANHVGYHGQVAGRSVFGVVNVETGLWHETPCANPGRYAGHCHASPDGAHIVTDGEATPDCISIARADEKALCYRQVCGHGWPRDLDQRFHPHPHWNSCGDITFTGCLRTGDGPEVRSYVGVLSGG